TRLVAARQVSQGDVAVDRLAIGRGDDVSLLEPRLVGGALVDDLGDPRPPRGVPTLDTQGELAGRGAHADLLAVDDGVDDVRVLAVVAQADAPEVALGQARGQPAPGLAAVGRLVQAAAGPPLLDRVIHVVAVGRRGLAAEAVELVAPALPGRHQ